MANGSVFTLPDGKSQSGTTPQFCSAQDDRCVEYVYTIDRANKRLIGTRTKKPNVSGCGLIEDRPLLHYPLSTASMFGRRLNQEAWAKVTAFYVGWHCSVVGCPAFLWLAAATTAHRISQHPDAVAGAAWPCKK